MKTRDAIVAFESVAALARALNISTSAIYQWGETVPALRAYEIRDLMAARGNAPANAVPAQAAA